MKGQKCSVCTKEPFKKQTFLFGSPCNLHFVHCLLVLGRASKSSITRTIPSKLEILELENLLNFNCSKYSSSKLILVSTRKAWILIIFLKISSKKCTIFKFFISFWIFSHFWTFYWKLMVISITKMFSLYESWSMRVQNNQIFALCSCETILEILEKLEARYSSSNFSD